MTNQSHGFRSEIPDAGLVELYDLWTRMRGELNRLPRRQEIDPLDLPRAVMPRMIVFEREPDGRVRCRLAGTAVAEVFGFEPGGR